MYVDVDFVWRQFDEQHRRRIDARRDHRAVGLGQSFADDPVPHVAAVDEEILAVSVRPRGRRRRDEAARPHLARFCQDFDQVADEFAAEDLISALAQIGGWRRLQALAIVVRQRERQPRVGQSVMRHQVGDVITFGGLGFQKFAPRRDVEEEVADFEFGAARKGYVAHVEQPPAADLDLGPGHLALPLRAQTNLRDRGDRSQRLAAKAERHDRLEVLGGFDLAGRVALERQYRVVARHALAIVADADRPTPARFDRDLDTSRPGVNRIFDQLFDYGRGPLDHFPGGDLVRKTVWKNPDFRHCLKPILSYYLNLAKMSS